MALRPKLPSTVKGLGPVRRQTVVWADRTDHRCMWGEESAFGALPRRPGSGIVIEQPAVMSLGGGHPYAEVMLRDGPRCPRDPPPSSTKPARTWCAPPAIARRRAGLKLARLMLDSAVPRHVTICKSHDCSHKLLLWLVMEGGIVSRSRLQVLGTAVGFVLLLGGVMGQPAYAAPPPYPICSGPNPPGYCGRPSGEPHTPCSKRKNPPGTACADY